MEDKQYKNMNEVLEDAEKALTKTTVSTKEDSAVLKSDATKLMNKMGDLESNIDHFLRTHPGFTDPYHLEELQGLLEQSYRSFEYIISTL